MIIGQEAVMFNMKKTFALFCLVILSGCASQASLLEETRFVEVAFYLDEVREVPITKYYGEVLVTEVSEKDFFESVSYAPKIAEGCKIAFVNIIKDKVIYQWFDGIQVKINLDGKKNITESLINYTEYCGTGNANSFVDINGKQKREKIDFNIKGLNPIIGI
jgi:hypothetical protein